MSDREEVTTPSGTPPRVIPMKSVPGDMCTPPCSPCLHDHSFTHDTDALASLKLIEGTQAEESGGWFSGQRKAPFVIGVTGGTASGKTTVCDKIIEALETHKVQLVSMDCFYKALDDEQKAEAGRNEYNFDHPNAFDFDLMREVLGSIRECRPTNIPTYDFCTHSRHPTETIHVPLVDVIILEGILVLHDPGVRDMCNIKIFVEVDADLRLLRRFKRDTVSRGRSPESVLEQYEKFVKPMHDQFIQPSMKFADIIVPRGAENQVAIDLVTSKIRTKLHEEDLQSVYPNMFITGPRPQVKMLLTPLRQHSTDRKTFCFMADRLIRLVVEEGLSHLPLQECRVVTPLGLDTVGTIAESNVCGVAIVRAGEAMETALRQVLKQVPIGKILFERSPEPSQEDPRNVADVKKAVNVLYAKFPPRIQGSYVLLMDPVIGRGVTACRAIEALLEQGVSEDKIIFVNLLCNPVGVHRIFGLFPNIKLVTCDIDRGLTYDGFVYPGIGNFGDRYYGTDSDETLLQRSPRSQSSTCTDGSLRLEPSTKY